MPIAFVCTCDKCKHKDYRLNASQKTLDTLRYMGKDGHFTCYHCHKGNMTVKQLKWKDTKHLIKNFPNKKAIFTTLSVEELLKLDDDLSSNPNVKMEK